MLFCECDIYMYKLCESQNHLEFRLVVLILLQTGRVSFVVCANPRLKCILFILRLKSVQADLVACQPPSDWPNFDHSCRGSEPGGISKKGPFISGLSHPPSLGVNVKALN